MLSPLPTELAPRPHCARATVQIQFAVEVVHVLIEIALAHAHAVVDGLVLLILRVGDAAPHFALGGCKLLQAGRGALRRVAVPAFRGYT